MLDYRPMTEIPASAPTERRSLQRHRSLLGAQIIFRNGNCSMTCQILDIAETGALLRPLEMALCPNEFVLKPRFDPPRKCEVIWRKGGVVGVRFVSPEGPLR
jgi:hypothetical protein